MKYVTVNYRDRASNTMQYSDIITLNTSMPGETGVSINYDAAVTNQPTVTLTLKAPPGIRQMMLSNSSRFVSAEWEPYLSTRSWLLDYNPDVNIYPVYVLFQHTDGTISARYDDLITLKLLTPPPSVDNTAPSGSMVINAGADATTSPVVNLDVLAMDNSGGVGVQWMYFREWEYDPVVMQWLIVNNSGWLPYADSTTWELAHGTGVKYVGAWFADAANNVSNPVILDSINLTAPDGALGETEITQYRQIFDPGHIVTVTLQVTEGDADLYIWRPGSSAIPDYWSNSASTTTEQLIFTAVEGEYLIEVHGYTDSRYTLDISTDEGDLMDEAQTVKGSSKSTNQVLSKPLPAQPLVTTKPNNMLNEEPKIKIYLPIVLNEH